MHFFTEIPLIFDIKKGSGSVTPNYKSVSGRVIITDPANPDPHYRLRRLKFISKLNVLVVFQLPKN